MKKIEEVLNSYDEYKIFLDDRFGIRFADFLTTEQLEKIGFKIKEEYIEEHNNNIKEWNKENVINQLKEDIEFGIEKAEDKRGISSSLMFDVVKNWLKILEDYDTLEYFNDYYDYGLNGFYPARDKYCGGK